jgi:hypothetical protein
LRVGDEIADYGLIDGAVLVFLSRWLCCLMNWVSVLGSGDGTGLLW